MQAAESKPRRRKSEHVARCSPVVCVPDLLATVLSNLARLSHSRHVRRLWCLAFALCFALSFGGVASHVIRRNARYELGIGVER